MKPRLVRWTVQAVLLLVASFLGSPSSAQKAKAPPNPPLAPTINMPFPVGAQRGTTLKLNLTGANLADPVALWTSIPGAQTAIPTADNNGKDNGRLTVTIDIPKEAPLGFYTVRLLTTRGLSNLRLFCVDDLPQLLKSGKNTSRVQAQALPVPCVVCGTIDAETSDFYTIDVQAGQRLSMEILGRRLGSTFDPRLAVIDPKSGREIAFSHDAPGLQTDARITHTFREAGPYLIEVRDVLYRGGAELAYRLRIGDFPCATTPIPMAARRGTKLSVNFAGPAVENVPPVEVTVADDPTLDTIWVTPRGANGLCGWPVTLAVSDLDEVVEQEPNNEPAQANRVPVPGAVTGRFQEKNDIDHFALKFEKRRYLIDAHTAALNSPTRVYMVLRDAKGAEVAKTVPNDPARANRIDFTAPAEGEYVLAVEQLHYWGGPSESYRITVVPYEPGFDVVLASDRADVPQGNAAVVAVQSVTRRDYAGPIELSVVGHPGLTGQTIFTGRGGPAVPNQPQQAVLLVNAAADLPLGVYPLRIQARAMIDGKPVVSYASVRPALLTALAGLPFPPRTLNTELCIGILDKPPFTLACQFDPAEAIRGGAATAVVTATRAAGFDEEIALSAVALPPGVTAAIQPIAKGSNASKIELKVPANAVLGQYPISFTGRSQQQGKSYAATAPLVPLVVASAFALQVEPEKPMVDVGGKVKIRIVAVRKGKYAGPIGLVLRNLPAGVSAAPATIAAGTDAVEIELSAAANAAVGDKADIHILGTATAAGNQEDVSPNFTLSVVKK